MHRSFLALAAVVAVAGAAAFIPACSNEGEGERCDIRGDNNGNDECQSGLTCTLGTSLPSKPGSDVCCPSDLTSTTPICSRQTGIDAGLPPIDASPSGADSGDATVVTDTGIDTGSDTGTDAGTDSGDAASDAVADAPANG